MVTLGETISHYRILEELGHGGMGVVYRARDEHLPRDVALKVLPSGLFADETARSRFRREAQTLSQLNHPNIAVVHDFDNSNGVDFLAMEFVEGETLAAKVAAGPLPEKEVVALGTQIAEALEEAHEHGIIHRDLKPGNVMVTSKGRAKVLDFGLAKLLKPAQADAATASLAETQTGAVMGTLPYMSPEQLQGKQADARTDVYALGTVLYEMATGHRPFPQEQTSPLIAAILTQAPKPARELNAQVSAGLEAIIQKAMENRPEQRYQSANEVREDLGRLSVPGSVVGAQRRNIAGRWVHAALGAAVVILAFVLLIALNVAGLRDRVMRSVGAIHESPLQIRSIAVLPLANLSGDPEQEYFADGMTEELITNLGKISALRVISRTTAMHYKGTKKTLPEIAKELNVDAVIEGSVLRAGDRVRISAQLIQAATDKDLWAESYERDLSDILSLQSEVAGAIAGEVRSSLTLSEQRRLAGARAVNPEAYDAYLAGRLHWYKNTPEELDRALEYFRLARQKDANYALAYVGIGSVWEMRAHIGLVPSREGWPKAKQAATTALELDDSLAEAHELLANALAWYEWDWAAGEREYRRAIELNPNYASVRCFYSFFLHAMRRDQEARLQIDRALELDPYNGFFQMALGMELVNQRRPDEALAALHKAEGFEPDNPFVHGNLSYAFAQKGNEEQAQAETKQYFTLLGRTEVAEALERGYVQGGHREAARRAADTLVAESKRGSSVNPVEIASLYADAGDKDRALDWLERAYRERSTMLPYLNVWRFPSSVRSDPRFQDLLRRMNFPP